MNEERKAETQTVLIAQVKHHGKKTQHLHGHRVDRYFHDTHHGFFSFILGLFTPTGTTHKGKNFNPNVHIIPKLARGGDRVLISFTHTPLACRTTGYGNTPCPAQVVYSDIQ